MTKQVELEHPDAVETIKVFSTRVEEYARKGWKPLKKTTKRKPETVKNG